MNRETLALLHPHLSDEKLDQAVALYTAAAALRDQLAAHPNEALRACLLQQWGQLVQSAISTL